MKTLRYLLSGILALFITASAYAGPKNAKAALGGYCPVCYIAAGKAAKGTDEFKATYKGKTYLFVNDDALSAFKKNPQKFVPAYDGKCAFCMSKGKTADADPKVFMVHKGRIFLNANKELEKKFKDGLDANIATADKNYKASMKKK